MLLSRDYWIFMFDSGEPYFEELPDTPDNVKEALGDLLHSLREATLRQLNEYYQVQETVLEKAARSEIITYVLLRDCFEFITNQQSTPSDTFWQGTLQLLAHLRDYGLGDYESVSLNELEKRGIVLSEELFTDLRLINCVRRVSHLEEPAIVEYELDIVKIKELEKAIQLPMMFRVSQLGSFIPQGLHPRLPNYRMMVVDDESTFSELALQIALTPDGFSIDIRTTYYVNEVFVDIVPTDRDDPESPLRVVTLPINMRYKTLHIYSHAGGGTTDELFSLETEIHFSHQGRAPLVITNNLEGRGFIVRNESVANGIAQLLAFCNELTKAVQKGVFFRRSDLEFFKRENDEG